VDLLFSDLEEGFLWPFSQRKILTLMRWP
jgi:hypothetical protein